MTTKGGSGVFYGRLGKLNLLNKVGSREDPLSTLSFALLFLQSLGEMAPYVPLLIYTFIVAVLFFWIGLLAGGLLHLFHKDDEANQGVTQVVEEERLP